MSEQQQQNEPTVESNEEQSLRWIRARRWKLGADEAVEQEQEQEQAGDAADDELRRRWRPDYNWSHGADEALAEGEGEEVNRKWKPGPAKKWQPPPEELLGD